MRTIWQNTSIFSPATWVSTVGRIRKGLLTSPIFDDEPNERQAAFTGNISRIAKPAPYYFFTASITNISDFFDVTEFVGSQVIVYQSDDASFFPQGLEASGLGPSSIYNPLIQSSTKMNTFFNFAGQNTINEATVLHRAMSPVFTPSRFFRVEVPVGYFDPAEAGTPLLTMKLSVALRAIDYAPEAIAKENVLEEKRAAEGDIVEC